MYLLIIIIIAHLYSLPAPALNECYLDSAKTSHALWIWKSDNSEVIMGYALPSGIFQPRKGKFEVQAIQ